MCIGLVVHGAVDMSRSSLPRPLIILGLAGVVPQAICFLLAMMDGPYRWIGLAAGCFYAATILSFLGGMWWMAGSMAGVHRARIYILTVIPSLVSWASLMPWVFGWRWPAPSLFALGVLLLLSPLADARISREVVLPRGWLTLRAILACGLGLLTIALAAF